MRLATATATAMAMAMFVCQSGVAEWMNEQKLSSGKVRRMTHRAGTRTGRQMRAWLEVDGWNQSNRTQLIDG
jgi:hypothetical protein